MQQLSTQISLPERAHVIVSDLRGVLPFWRQHLPTLIDARQRLLAPGGKLVPLRDTLWIAGIEAPQVYHDAAGPWEANCYGLDMSLVRQTALNKWRRICPHPKHLFLAPQLGMTLDYQTVSHPEADVRVHWTAERAGILHGLSVWFETTLAPGIGFSNAPHAPRLIYGNAFFPLTSPVPLASGATVSVRLQANLIGDEYVWRWDTTVRQRGPSEAVNVHYRQSSFLGAPLSRQQALRRSSTYVPVLNDDGDIEHTILTLMDGSRSLEVIARVVAERFPASFKTLEEALRRVGQVSERYSR